MKKTDLAYMAGIFDGEGTIVIHTRKYVAKTGRETTQDYLEVCICSIDEWLPRYFMFAFTGNVYLRKAQTDRTKPVWVWQCSGEKARCFLETLLPFIKLKRMQAELGISFQQIKHARGNRDLSDADLVWRQAQRLLISSYNQRKGTRPQMHELNAQALSRKANAEEAPVK